LQDTGKELNCVMIPAVLQQILTLSQVLASQKRQQN